MRKSSSRRAFLKQCGVGGLLGVTALGLRGASSAPPLNLVLIMADDISADELGCYGHPTHRTPNVDRLAATGVQYRTCYSTPICHPTRFMIMTGQYGHHNRVHQFAGRPGGPKPGDPAEDITTHRTFAQQLKAHGYRTGLAGKWQLSGKIPTLVHEAGFDEYRMWAYTHNLPPGVSHRGGWEGKPGGKTSRYWHPSIVENGRYLPTKPDDYGPDLFTNFAIDFMRRHRNERFCLYYPMALTHAPYYTTPDTTRSAEDKFTHRKENWQANVEYADKLVGRIVAALEEFGLRKNTIVFFTGDNGTGGHGKGQPTERGARVPMIVNCPGIVKPLGKIDALTDFSDVFPTLAGFADAPLPDDRPIDGVSQVPVLLGRKDSVREWIYSYIGGWRILRDRRWLLERDSPTHPGRLYDCGNSRDGSGYRDVTDSRDPEVVAARKRFAEILADKPVPDVDHRPRTSERRPAAANNPHGSRQILGTWSTERLAEADRWTAGFNRPVVAGTDDGLRISVRQGENRGVAMIPGRFQVPAGARKIRVRVASLTPGATWLFKLAGDVAGSGRTELAHVNEGETATGIVERPLEPKVVSHPETSWFVKLGITGPPGAAVTVSALDFVE